MYLSGRFISAMDAMWRIFGYQTYPSSKPKVRVIKVKPEEAVMKLLKIGRSCDLLVYFYRPECLNSYKYTELYNEYVVEKKIPTRYRNRSNMEGVEYFPINITGLKSKLYLCKRANTSYPAITRMEMLYLTAGDIWYLRLILKYTSPASFKEAKSHEGTTYVCYQGAALAKGLVTEHKEVIKSFEELISYSTPRELRGLFCIHLMHGWPMIPVYDDPNIRFALMADFLADRNNNEEYATNDLLLDLKYRLDEGGGQNLAFYGFEDPLDDTTELAREILTQGSRASNLQLLHELNQTEPNNPGQQQIYDALSAAFDNPPKDGCEFYFIGGPAGVGKTSLGKKLHANARSKGHMIKICATTLAAALYKGGVTAHSLFKYPVSEDDDGGDIEDPIACQLWGTERLDVLRECKVLG